MSNSLVKMPGTLTWSDIVYTGTGLPTTGDIEDKVDCRMAAHCDRPGGL